jgi:hypothetical protein
MKLRNNTESIPNHGAPRDAAIFQDLDLVNRIARRFQRRVPPCVTFDDLASAGMIGLIHAVDRFDQTRGLKFRTYAQHESRERCRISSTMEIRFHELNGSVFVRPRQPSVQRATEFRPLRSASIRSRYGAWHLRPSPHSRFAPRSERLADASPRERIG